jgi:hypothetical protein
MQGPCGNEREYLTRLAQTTTNKNISEQILLAVGIVWTIVLSGFELWENVWRIVITRGK